MDKLSEEQRRKTDEIELLFLLDSYQAHLITSNQRDAIRRALAVLRGQKDANMWADAFSHALHTAYQAMCEGRDREAMNFIGEAIGLSPDAVGDAWKNRPVVTATDKAALEQIFDAPEKPTWPKLPTFQDVYLAPNDSDFQRFVLAEFARIRAALGVKEEK